MSDVHVVPHGDGWALEVSGDKQEAFDWRDDAIRRGRGLAEQEEGELVIHGKSARSTRTGTIHETSPAS